jgi:hypothetical protein
MQPRKATKATANEPQVTMTEVDLDQLHPDCLHDLGFRKSTADLAFAAMTILQEGQPMTLRGCFYRMVSAGWFPSTDVRHYRQLGRILTKLREARVVPFRWIVDGIRDTYRPSSWSGLADFADTVRDAYRKDFWSTLSEYVHVFCEKDAMAGVLRPVTHEFDVALSIVRGYTSVSLAAAVAADWAQIEKPITAYYLGDFDPSGLDLERDLRAKLKRYCPQPFTWVRLGVEQSDFEEFNLFPLAAKAKDRRTAKFLAAGYTVCAELDAIPADALRRRLSDAIVQHIPVAEWERLQHIERLERERWQQTLDQMQGLPA